MRRCAGGKVFILLPCVHIAKTLAKSEDTAQEQCTHIHQLISKKIFLICNVFGRRGRNVK